LKCRQHYIIIGTAVKQIAEAYTAHLRGDEIKPLKIIDSREFGMWLKVVSWVQKDLLEDWWTNLAPKDNHIVINIETGAVT